MNIWTSLKLLLPPILGFCLCSGGQYSGSEGTLDLNLVRGQGDHTLWIAWDQLQFMSTPPTIMIVPPLLVKYPDKSYGHLPNVCPEPAPGDVQIFQCSLKQLSSIPSFSYPFPIQSGFCCTPDFVSCKWLFLVYACSSELFNDLLFLLDAWLFPRNQLISVLLSLSALNLLSQST